MVEHLITTGGRTYRVVLEDDESEDVAAFLAWLVESRGSRWRP